MRPGRGWWIAYAAGAALTLAAMVAVSLHLLDLERSALASSAEVHRADRLRVALWRMDSWLTPLIAQEAARPWYEYRAFYEPPEGQYTAQLQEVPQGAVITRSPLLAFRSDYLPLHFQIEQDQSLNSPQVPSGNQRDLAEATALTGAEIEASTQLLGEVMSCVAADPAWSERLETAPQEVPVPDAAQEKLDWVQRANAADPAKLKSQANAREKAQAAAAVPAVEVGPFLPLWLPRPDAAGGHMLVYLRRVRGAGLDLHQGFVVNWPVLRSALLEQVEDLLPGADLQPVLDPAALDEDLGTRLATAPLRLAAPVALGPDRAWQAAAGILTLTWAAVLGALLLGALALRASVRWGEKRQRFASAVTHELRTPLTTFRMYAEMLAQGMVTEESKRQEYLRTLERESARLARVVENVLGYARVEDGRASLRREPHALADLLARIAPAAAERCAEAGMNWIVEDGGLGAEGVETDPDAVGLIVYNLVDNACKYAAAAADRRVLLRAALVGRNLRLTIEDFGPGLSPAHRARLFRAFDRGERRADDPAPGIGLGLALARSLARDLGGDLMHETKDGPGALFALLIPRAPLR
jgi:signal transduction histidine kinase